MVKRENGVPLNRPAKRGDLQKSKRGMSSTIATVFLVMITVAAVSVLWGVVFPFIDNNTDFSSYGVRLEIVTSAGYTVYDPVEEFAFIQVKRGQDEAELRGVELYMDFNGTGYKTTLRAPPAGSTRKYVFNLSNMAKKGKSPSFTSVAPVFSARKRSFIGRVTSSILIPYARIAKNITEMVFEIEREYEQGDEESFVIILNETIYETDYSICPPQEIEDPWGNCAIAQGNLINVTEESLGDKKFAYSDEDLEESWENTHSVIFVFDGGDGTSCLNNVRKTDCFEILGIGEETNYFNVGVTDELRTVEAGCQGDSYYVYNNLNCE